MVYWEQIPRQLTGEGSKKVDGHRKLWLFPFKEVYDCVTQTNGDREMIDTKHGLWHVYRRGNYQIPWFDGPQEIRLPVTRPEHEEDDSQYTPAPDRFFAFYIDKKIEAGDDAFNTAVLGNHADMELAEGDCRLLTRMILESPFYNWRILKGFLDHPIASVGVGCSAAIIIATANKEAMTPDVLKLVAGGGLASAAVTSYLLGDPSPSSNNETITANLRDSFVSRKFPERMQQYRYGSAAVDAIKTEYSAVREELKKAEIFGRWQEAGLGSDRKMFLDVYKELSVWDSTEKKLSAVRKIAQKTVQESVNDFMGKVTAVFSEEEPAAI